MKEVLFEQKFFVEETIIPTEVINRGFYYRISYYDDSFDWCHSTIHGGQLRLQHPSIIEYLESRYQVLLTEKLKRAQETWDKMQENIKSSKKSLHTPGMS